MSRCIHHVEICDECGGLAVTELTSVVDLGVRSVTLNMGDGTEVQLDPEQAFLGPIAPCDGERQ
ncbi:hypothetical protein OG592_27080 [Streptomyces avidinii]|uniref:hypothetical protein n=1 Tax=Streptomyces avidinii TaxID=1895 RepID=UPI00387034B6|nr:hypothetical protein OG592_27080 [Streptomyces avidinii]